MPVERIVRYKPKGVRSIAAMRKGTVADLIATTLMRKRGATIAELRDILIKKFGDPDKFKPNYVSGYLWDLGRRGYGLEYDRNGRYYLVLPGKTTALVYVPEAAVKGRRPPAARKSASKAGRGAVKARATSPRKPAKAEPAPRRARGAAKAEPAPRAATKAAKRPARTSARKAPSKVVRKTVRVPAAKRNAAVVVAAEKRKRVRKPKAKSEVPPADEELPPVEGMEYEAREIDTGREYDDGEIDNGVVDEPVEIATPSRVY